MDINDNVVEKKLWNTKKGGIKEEKKKEVNNKTIKI